MPDEYSFNVMWSEEYRAFIENSDCFWLQNQGSPIVAGLRAGGQAQDEWLKSYIWFSIFRGWMRSDIFYDVALPIKIYHR